MPEHVFYHAGMVRVVAWQVVPLGHTGQISNVSAFVLPVHMPAVEHRSEPSMAPDDATNRWLEVVHAQAKALDSALQLSLDLVLRQFGCSVPWAVPVPPRAKPEPEPESTSKSKPRYRPHDKRFREWGSFRHYFQQLEQTVVTRPGVRVEFTKEVAYTEGGPHPKTLTRIMTRTYGLNADQWPPSCWPVSAPVDTPALQPLLERLPPALVAAWALLTVCHHTHLVGIQHLLAHSGQILHLS